MKSTCSNLSSRRCLTTNSKIRPKSSEPGFVMVEVTHGDGYVTRYGHHKAVLVNTGDIVKKGQVIGEMGSSGRSTGPHVHFEVLKNGRHVDPARYVARRR